MSSELYYVQRKRMESNTEWLFTWKEHLFVSQIHNKQLLLKWTPLSSYAANAVPKDATVNTDSPECSVDHEPAAEIPMAFLDLDKDKEFKLLTSGFSFDPGCFSKVPVMVLGANALISKQKGTKKIVSCLLISVRTKAANLVSLTSSTTFEVKQLRTFYVSKKLKDITGVSSTINNIRVASYFNVLFLSATSATLEIYSAAGVSLCSSFDCDEYSSSSQLKILDTFCNHATHETFLLFTYLNDEREHQYRCLKLQHNSCSKGSEGETVPLEHLYPVDYSQLLSSVKLISLCSQRRYGDQTVRYFSVVFMLTTTGYILRFVNGSMASCVYLWESLQEKGNCTDSEWKSAKVNFVTMKRGSVERTALHLDSICLLIDWDIEKVVKVWQSVCFISSLNVMKSGTPHLLMILKPNERDDTKSWDLLQTSEHVKVVDCHAVAQVEGDETAAGVLRESSGSEWRTVLPQCAVDALLAQKKRYECAVREARAELAAKEQFFVETWEQLRQLSTMKSSSKFHSNCQSSLVPLIEGSSQTAETDNSSVKLQSSSVKGLWQSKSKISHASLERCTAFTKSAENTRDSDSVEIVGDHWYRTFGSLVIVGAQVRNIGHRPIVEAHIHVIPAGSSSFSMLKCVTGSESAPLDPSNRASEQLGCRTSASCDTSSTVEPGSQRTLTCWVDTAQVFSPDDLRFFLFVSYSVDSDSASEASPDAAPAEEHCLQRCEVCCGEIVLPTQHLISATFSLEKIFSPMQMESSAPTLDDILALDAVQECTSLVIKSVVSSVQCLESKVKTCPDFKAVPGLGSGHNIFVTDHQLRLCRLKLLDQVSKREGRLQIFTRAVNQAVLLVKFLHSILPDDVTLLPELPSPSLAVEAAYTSLYQELHGKIARLKSELEKEEEVHIDEVASSDDTSGQPSVSPTFHSRKLGQSRSKPDSVNSGEGVASPNTYSDNGYGIDKERKKFAKAKRKLQGQLGDDCDL